MNWRPEDEVDEDQQREIKRSMLRDEAVSIVMTMIEAQVCNKGIKLDAATDAAIEQAPKVLKFLNETTPF